MTAPLRCAICGSRFAEKQCYFCESKICTSCVVPADVSGSYSTIKCLECERKHVDRLSILKVLRRNLYIIGILVGFWLFAIFPLPFLEMAGLKVDPTAYQPVLMVTGALAIPFVFMFIAWQKRSPRS
ncbi:MAG TPA: hypothetical protein VIE86_00135 [Nitrososphaera sp.]